MNMNEPISALTDEAKTTIMTISIAQFLSLIANIPNIA